MREQDVELDLITLREERGIEGVSFENCETLSGLLIEVCRHLPEHARGPASKDAST
jgi:hypothetical protein